MKPIKIIIGSNERCPEGYAISHVIRRFDIIRNDVVCYRRPLHIITSWAYHVGQWFVWIPHRLARRQWGWRNEIIVISDNIKSIDKQIGRLQEQIKDMKL